MYSQTCIKQTLKPCLQEQVCQNISAFLLTTIMAYLTFYYTIPTFNNPYKEDY